MEIEKSSVIGVLGGYGPYATVEFYRLLLQNTTAKKDWDFNHIIIDSNPRIPSRARAYLFNEASPVEYMKEGINRLKKAGADFFVCPCNTAHFFLRKIKDDFPLPFVDMVNATIEEILKHKIKSIGIIGSEVTVLSQLYEKELVKHNIRVENVNDLSDVRFIIEAAKQNKNLKIAKQKMLNIIKTFSKLNVDAVIYACTELLIVLPINECSLKVFETSDILAKKAIKKTKMYE